MKPICLVKAGTTFPGVAEKYGDFEDWIATGIGLVTEQIQVVNVYENKPLPPAESFSGIVVTGSHSMVTDSDAWIARLSLWVRDLVRSRIPFLGLCFGHQVLAHTMGGMVGYHPGGREIGTVLIKLSDEGKEDRLTCILPGEFYAHVTHSQSILKLPENTVVLAGNAFEHHHAIRIGECAWGVQFHPEFDTGIMRSYIEEQKLLLGKEDFTISEILTHVCDANRAKGILQRFVSIVKEELRENNS